MDSIVSKDNSYIFIDFSNIYIGFYNYIMHNCKKYKISNPKMDYNMLFSIIEKNKNIKKKVLVGSFKNTKKIIKEENLKKIFNNLGYEVLLLERIDNKEYGVDDLLHKNIINTLLFEKPGTIIIATGDGKNGDYTNNSFYEICINALKRGWCIKIISWRKQLSKKFIIGNELCNILKDINIKKSFDILYLDDYADILLYN
jgi:hypothetical protein